VFRYRRYSRRRVPPAVVAATVAAFAFAAHSGQAGTAAHAAAAAGGSGTIAPTHATAAAIAFARAQLGKPYLWGGTGPDAYDCSGLVQAAWTKAGVPIDRTSQDQWATLPHVTAGQLRPGDLVFYTGYLAPGEAPPGHVAMYIGGGQMIEAYATGYPIRVTGLRSGAWGYARPGGA
jgi:peptidoglycan DL-endopeptidase CwlO